MTDNLPTTTTGSSVAIRNVSKALKITSKLLATTDELTAEDWEWWNGLEDEWKKILTVHLYKRLSINFDDSGTFSFNRFQEIGKTELDNPETDLKKILKLDFLACEYYDGLPTSILFKLTELKKIHLRIFFLQDITHFSNLQNLTSLSLGFNEITNISSLSSLQNLTRLSIWRNQVNDIKPLEGLKNLVRLDLLGNQISDISALADLQDLTTLDLDSNKITNIIPLKNLINLVSLDISNNPVKAEDIHWLQNQLPNCKILSDNDNDNDNDDYDYY